MAEIRNILACDTSTSTLHIALKCEEGFEERMIAGGFQHSEDLLQEITYMLERRKLKVADLDLLVCTRGPGSFTSLRIAMATLKGFSLAKNIPLVSVPTLEAVAGAYMIPDVLTLAVLDKEKTLTAMWKTSCLSLKRKKLLHSQVPMPENSAAR